MQYARICDRNHGGKTVAVMPLFVWQLTGWLCKHEGSLGTLGGLILDSYRLDHNTGRSWLASLWSGIRTWWSCRACC